MVKVCSAVYRSLELLALIVTVLGLPLIFSQLKELNSHPEVDVKFHLAFATSTIAFGPSVSEPVDIRLVVRNDGDRTSLHWRASVLFCKDIAVVDSDPSWRGADSELHWYFFESDKAVYRESIFFDELDGIGMFRLILPTRKESIPIALVSVDSEGSPHLKLVSLSLDGEGFVYEDFQAQDGKILTDFRGCIDLG